MSLRRVLILAAHGSDEVPTVNRRVEEMALRVASAAGYDVGLAAFQQGEPKFADALDGPACAGASDVIVVPLMTSAGYYATVALPQELQRNASYDSGRVRITEPVGVHPRMATVVCDRAIELAERFELVPGDTTLALIGHGTKRHPASGRSTESLAERIRGSSSFAQVLTAFLDQNPPVESILDASNATNLLSIPFLISDGPHTTEDVPRRLQLDSPGGEMLTSADWRSGRAVCDTAIGNLPGVEVIATDIAWDALTFAATR